MSNAPTSSNATGATPQPLMPNTGPLAGAPAVPSGASMTLQQQQQYQIQYQQQLQRQQQQAGTQQLQHTTYATQQTSQGQVAQPQAQPQQGQNQNSQPTQQHLPHQGLNGGWQSDKDVDERRKMIAKIVHLLRMRKPNAPQEWLSKLPQMAKRLEESLYRSAKSFAEYNEASTLKQRLQQLAVNIGMKTRKLQQAQQAQKQQQLQAQQAAFQPQQFPQQPQQQGVQSATQQASQAVPSSISVPQGQPAPAPTQRQMVSMSDINPIASVSSQQRTTVSGNSTGNPGSRPVAGHGQFRQSSSAAAAPQAPQPSSSQAPVSSSSGTPQISDRQQVLRHQQQRLLLLRHAAKCQHDDQRCPVTPHCAGMKRLWKHIAECKDQKCLVPHCVSSRYVLSHYHRCKDVRCPVCGPVREAIHRSHEKQKQMQALKQRHQQALASNSSGAQQGVRPPAPLGDQSKRRKSNSGVAVPAPGYSSGQPNGSIVRGQNYALAKSGIPHQPLNPQLKAGYVYNKPASGAARPAPPGVPSVPGIAYSNGQVIMPKHSGPKPQEDHTLINCFSIDQIEKHIQSLNKGLQLNPQQLKTQCLGVLKVLQTHDHAWVFNTPVDPVELGLPDYFEVIKRPMDLGTIKKRLENGCYHSLDEFEEHVNVTFDNAMLYNPDGSVVFNMAKEMKAKFQHDYALLMKRLRVEEDAKRKNGEACILCGCEKLLFEPPVFYCNGPSCPSKRIRRNSYYYVGGNNQYHWCHQCFGDLKERQLIELGDITLKKEQLLKKKNDEVHEESWVQCDKCERWVHQICALFNTRQNKDHRSEYNCPRCTIKERKSNGVSEGTSSTPMAEDLPRTKLSETLETHVRKKVDEYFSKMAEGKAKKDSISLEEAKKGLSMGGEITIRQVTSMDRKLEVRDRMKSRYAFKKYPDEFTYRCKCIVVFQNLDGVDVVLFGLYVYEHDEKNPAPNTRAVYISYLDSVHYMRPRNMRTLIYHEILISYLDYVRQKGFLTAHIWACPPLKGDDYILYCKPEDQKTPKDDRLRQWYVDMLRECQKRGICGRVTNMYDHYFADEKNDASMVPYMEGDYFPAEVENIIKDIEEGKGAKKSGGAGKKKKSTTTKSKKKSGSRGGTRSTGLDEDALAASGFMPPGMNQKSLEEGGRDYVMAKLGETIHPMKESFLVAFLASENQDPKHLGVPKELEEDRTKYLAKLEAEKKVEEVTVSEPAPDAKPESSDATGGMPAAEEIKEVESKDVDLKDVEMGDAEEPVDKPPESETDKVLPASEKADDSAPESKETAAETNEGSCEPTTPADESSKPEVESKDQQMEAEEQPKASTEDAVTTSPERVTKSSEEEASEALSEEPKAGEEASKTDLDPTESAVSSTGEPGTSKTDENDAIVEGDKSEAVSADSEPTGSSAVEEDTLEVEPIKPADEDTKSAEATAVDGDVIMASSETVSPETDNSSKPTVNDDKPEGSPAAAAAAAAALSDETPAETDKKVDTANATGDVEPAEPSSEPARAVDEASPPNDGPADDQAVTDLPTEESTAKEGQQTEGSPETKDGKVKPEVQTAAPHREGKFAAMAARKRNMEGEPKEDENDKKENGKPADEKDKESTSITVKDSKGRMVKVIDDDLEEMDCEFLNNRQAFLNLCQGNHYQFDYVRRAKHSSMMVLWHLHNRDAPKFVQQCAICSREILAGYRYHCPICADYDQCAECVRNPSTPRHAHQLKPVPVASGQQAELTDAQRRERQRSIQLHMTLLLHAATCKSSSCPSANCTKMKGLLQHGSQCKIKATGGCHVCKRIWALLQLHARTCKASTCPVPNCMAIREKFRQLKKQQQAMDDRRRVEMNRHYRGLAR